jgi:site-specific recombinase XerD
MSYSAKVIQRTDAIRLDGTAALGLQVIIHRKRKVFPLKIWVKPSEVDVVKPLVKLERVGKEWKDLEKSYNAVLLDNLSRALAIIAQAQAERKPLDIVKFTNQFTNAVLDQDFIGFIANAIEQERGLLAASTTKDNEKVLARLKRFRPALNFNELSVATIKEFQKDMQKWGLGPNTIASTHKGLRKFILMAKLDYPSIQNPYKHFKIRWAEADRDFLTPAELKKVLEAYDQPSELDGALRRTCRCFLFQCFTGMRVSDAKALTNDNMVGEHLVFMAEKTKRVKLTRKLKLNRIALKLVADAAAEKVGKRQDGSLMRFYEDDQVYNRSLKSMAAWLGIEKKLTSHVGRHTFATNYLIAGGKVERLMKLLGHSELETTMVYVHLVEEYLDEDMEGLADYFKAAA